MDRPPEDPKTHKGTAIIALTHRGAEMGRSLAASLGDAEPAATLYLDRRFYQDGEDAIAFDLPLRPLVQRWFGEHSALVLFLSAGACIRLLAPSLEGKQQDPAVVCVDDAGRFCVSLLSGHLGGADRLAERVAECLGATAVVTSASHASGTLAVDLLGQEFGWKVEADSTTVTRASAAVVNLRPVGICQEAGETGWWPDDQALPGNITLYPSLEDLATSPCDAALLITDRVVRLDELLADKAVVVYRPQSLVAGMGCRRGVSVEHLEQLLGETFAENGLSLASLSCIGTADIKRDEAGLMQLAQRHGVPLRVYHADELNALYERPDSSGDGAPTPSERAHDLVGVWGVSEPAALLASGAARLLVTRKNTDRATIAVARRPFDGAQS